jgi:preprotein translocase subunit SecF
VRSFNTSLTVLIVVVAILLFGGSATKYFALALTAGVVAGTYSSLALAAPLLVAIEARQKPKTHKKD